jgi:hypothetical protein
MHEGRGGDQTLDLRPCKTSFRLRDNLRGFFDKCFPNLLKRIFGYDDYEASWLNLVTKVRELEPAAWRQISMRDHDDRGAWSARMHPGRSSMDPGPMQG